MDDHFGDVYGIISDREIEISHELAQYVLQYEELLTSCSDICGKLDRFAFPELPDLTHLTMHHSLLALAQGAKQYNLCHPRVTQENVIQIKGGRYVQHHSSERTS